MPSEISAGGGPEIDARLRELIEGLDIVVWEAHHGTGIYTFISRRVETLFGYPADRWKREPGFWNGLIHPDDRERAVGIRRTEASLGRDHTIEYRAITKDGATIWLRDTAQVARDSEGNVIRLGGIIMDVTERRRAERSLWRTAERFLQIAESITEVFWMTSADRREIIYVSPAFEEIWGRSIQSLYDNPMIWIDAIHPDDRERLRANSFADSSREKYEEDIFRIVRPNGAVRWIRSHAFPIRNEKGAIYRVAGTAMDFTAQKEAQDALRKSEATSRALLNALPDLTFRIGRDGVYRDFKPGQ